MHAVSLAKLRPFLPRVSRIGDVGCGTGFSTLQIAYLAGLESQNPTHITGFDVFSDLIEKATINRSKIPLADQVSVNFKNQDIFKQRVSERLDLCTVGFSVPLGVLEEVSETTFNKDCIILAPIQNPDSLEQDYTLMRFDG